MQIALSSNMHAQIMMAWRPMSYSRSTDVLPPSGRMLSSISTSNIIGSGHQHRPLTPEQSAFIDSFTPRFESSSLARPAPLIHTYGDRPVRVFTGKRFMSQPFAASAIRSAGKETFPATPRRLDRPVHANPLGVEHRVEEWVEPHAAPTRYQQDNAWSVSPDSKFNSGSGSWHGATYGGVPTVARRTEVRASSFAASTQRGRMRPNVRDAPTTPQSWDQQEKSRSPRWTDWRVRKVGGLGHWD